MPKTTPEIIKKIKSLKNERNIAGMKRFGIVSKDKIYGLPVPVLRQLGKEIGENHELALKLWLEKIYEAKILASFIADKKQLTSHMLDEWVKDFDNWATCDTVCGSLFSHDTELAHKKVWEWTKSEKEFIRRAGFALLAWLAVRDKQSLDERFEKYFPLIKKYSTDERNFVRKAVNWALCQIGKRRISKTLKSKAIKLAEEILEIDSKTAKWVASNALTELRQHQVKK